MGANTKIYEMITGRILALLDEGVIPWQASWTGGGFLDNLVSGRRYRGINVFILAGAGYTSKYWMTYKQAVEAGGTVCKGEKGTQIIFWKFFKKEEINRDKGEVEINRIPVLRYYTVFNLNQTKGIKDPDEENTPGKDLVIENAAAYIDGWSAVFQKDKKIIIYESVDLIGFFIPGLIRFQVDPDETSLPCSVLLSEDTFSKKTEFVK